MRMVFQHKYIVRMLAVLALGFALASIAEPLLNEYNSDVVKKQSRLKADANRTEYNEISFCLGTGGRNNVEVFHAFIALFFCLLLSKRIMFSFIFASLYIIQFPILLAAEFQWLGEDRFENHSVIFALLFIAFVFALSFLQSSVICHFAKEIYPPEPKLK